MPKANTKAMTKPTITIQRAYDENGSIQKLKLCSSDDAGIKIGNLKFSKNKTFLSYNKNATDLNREFSITKPETTMIMIVINKMYISRKPVR